MCNVAEICLMTPSNKAYTHANKMRTVLKQHDRRQSNGEI